MKANQKVWSLILAGGSGARFGKPKQFEMLGSERLVDRVVRIAGSVSAGVTLVVPQGVDWDGDRVDHTVTGGSTHMDSARRGLEFIPSDVTSIVIGLPSHPLASQSLYQRLVDHLVERQASACAPAAALPDALKHVVDDTVIGTQSRTNIVAVPFPAAFDALALREALAAGPDGSVTDYAEELEAVEVAGGTVVVIDNEPTNIHVTTPEELEIARRLLSLVPDG